jgi:hypothetical protein
MAIDAWARQVLKRKPSITLDSVKNRLPSPSSSARSRSDGAGRLGQKTASFGARTPLP